MLKGTSLVGAGSTRKRIEYDYYATPHDAICPILDRIPLRGSVLEPCSGGGHISKYLELYSPKLEVVSTDLIDRGYGTGGIDFLTHNYVRKFNNVVTNPPFSLAKEFIERSLEITTDYVLILAKIQLLESAKRKDMFANSPLEYVYVFSDRITPLPNGIPHDEKGKPWNSTMCFCWFCFKHGYKGEPIIRWI